MPEYRFGNLQATEATKDKLRNLLSNPRTRAAVSRKLNTESREIAKECTDLAEKELYRRPDDRRSPESLAFGKHYIDSFEAVPAKEVGANRLRVAVRNTHPAHAWVERGTRGHEIAPRNVKKLAFPYKGSRSVPGGAGRFGDWLLTGKNTSPTGAVQHPGAVEHRIMQRALRSYRRRARQRLIGRR